MTAVSIVKEQVEPGGEVQFRAIARNGATRESVGRTVGEALDALTAQLSEDESATMVVVQQMRPDQWFGEHQINRMRVLMDKSQAEAISSSERVELEQLVAEEFAASAKRTQALAIELGL